MRNFTLVRADVLDFAALSQSMRNVEFVFHLAGNADMRFGTLHPAKDLEQKTIGMNKGLQAMRETGSAKSLSLPPDRYTAMHRPYRRPRTLPFP